MTARILISAAQATLGLLVLLGIWLALPARWLPVDVGGTLVGVAALATAALAAVGRGRKLVRAVLWSELLIGTLVVSLLAMSLAQLAGSYGPVGAGGALLMGAIACLVFPYLVALPALQLAWLRNLE